MTIIFDYHAGEVYVENPDPRAEGTRNAKIYYFQPGKIPLKEARLVVNHMRDMYNLGQQHQKQEIRKVLGVN
jgi:hypothetical protein